MRADYLISNPHSLEVIEIKSDLDTLRRFDEQARVYSSFADRVVVVVGWTLAARVLRAAPNWWDVWLAERRDVDEIAIIPIRDGRVNPGREAGSLARMLPVAEARRAVASSGLSHRVTTMRADDARRTLAERLTLEELRAVVAEWLAHLGVDRRECVSPSLLSAE